MMWCCPVFTSAEISPAPRVRNVRRFNDVLFGSAVAFPAIGPMLKIQRTTDRTVIVLTISGRLDAENVSELCQSLAAEPADAVDVLDLADLVLADRDVIRLLRDLEARERIVLRNCPAFIRMWMAAENT